MKSTNKFFLLIISLIFILACNSEQNVVDNSKRTLPYLGFKDIEYIDRGGEMVADTIFHTIGNFYFTAHTSEPITNATVEGKIYVVDFFFSHCPTICPIMTENLKTLHTRTSDLNDLIFISHTIDPERDSLERLNEYINLHGIETGNNWFFVRGSQAYTYDIGKDEYLINADVDREAEGGFLHSEHFVLIDKAGHIRGMYEGTDTNEVNRLEQDIRLLYTTDYDKE
jgi:protein SCO1/2